MSGLPWFRLYSEAIDDEKLRMLAFEDRWHFIAIMCCKCMGILDENQGEKLHRRVALKMGLSVRELEEVARRLAEEDLIERDTLQPLAWELRQMRSDSSRDRVRAYRQRQKNKKQSCNVTVTAQEKDTDTDLEVTDVTKPRAGAFDDWYSIYPNKVGVKAARKAFDKAVKQVPVETLIAGLHRYIAEKPPDRPWCNPATWLNQGRWEDEFAATKPSMLDTLKDMANERQDEAGKPHGTVHRFPQIGSG